MSFFNETGTSGGIEGFSGELFAYLNAMMFILVGVGLLYNLVIREMKEVISIAGTEMRLLFLKWLCVSNLLRGISILVDVAVKDSLLDESWKTWTRDVFMALPSLSFITTYSIVVLFWAQIYYAAILVSYPLLKPFFYFSNCAAYTAFTIILLITLDMEAWRAFRVYLLLLLSLLYLLCAALLFNYGVKVAGHLAERRAVTGGGRTGGLIRRIVTLTSTVPLLLLLRGLFCLLLGSGIITTSNLCTKIGVSRLLWDNLTYFTTELLPSLLFIFMFWPNSDKNPEEFNSVFSSESMITSPLLRASSQPSHSPQEEQDNHWLETEQEIQRQLQL